MYTLFIGGIILVALTPLFKGTRRNVVDSRCKMSWDKTERIEQAGSSDVTVSDASLFYQARKLNRDRDVLPVSYLQATPYITEHP
jgi:hypothetical protein